MAEIINLRRYRKTKKRIEKEDQADKNRKKHGISKRITEFASVENEIEARKLDGSRLTTDE